MAGLCSRERFHIILISYVLIITNITLANFPILYCYFYVLFNFTFSYLFYFLLVMNFMYYFYICILFIQLTSLYINHITEAHGTFLNSKYSFLQFIRVYDYVKNGWYQNCKQLYNDAINQQYFQIITDIPILPYSPLIYKQTSIPLTSHYVTFPITFATSPSLTLRAVFRFQLPDAPLNYKVLLFSLYTTKLPHMNSALTISVWTSRSHTPVPDRHLHQITPPLWPTPVLFHCTAITIIGWKSR